MYQKLIQFDKDVHIVGSFQVRNATNAIASVIWPVTARRRRSAATVATTSGTNLAIAIARRIRSAATIARRLDI